MGAGINQVGARWLARERSEFGAAEHSHSMAERSVIQRSADSEISTTPPRYPLVDHLDGKRLLEWWLLLREFGLA